ncbi:MucB/RseB C-terminal domain-containing protein [Halieaceae bacterium]|nr:MucB/RseB C-terminal domain-containing protein [Halieaceae bacterium]
MMAPLPGPAPWRVPARVLLALVLFLGVPATLARECPGADATALEWLDKMSRSNQSVAYHGVVTFQRGDDLQVMQIERRVSGPAGTEQLTRLTGQGAQVLRADHPLDCLHPGHKLLQLGDQLAEGNCGIAKLYRLSVSEGERVAGRRAVRVAVEPRDMYRYGYVMELDKQTGLLLKITTIGRGDQVLERFQFADLTYGDAPAREPVVELVHRARHPNPHELSDAPGLGLPWGLGWLPQGFTLTDASTADAARRTYTDGLAVFSVFLERLAEEMPSGEGVARQGSTTSYTRGMQIGDEPVLVTVIGEVPVNTARMVADSLSRMR